MGAGGWADEHGYAEVATSDGFGYRYRHESGAMMDVMLPEGLERQRNYSRTASNRPGFMAAGGNQAIAKAERVPVLVNAVQGHVRRPSLLGALVAKANALIVESRDAQRHIQDLVTLAGISLQDPRSVLQSASAEDRRAVRRVLRRITEKHRVLRGAEDPEAVLELLRRLADPQG